MIYLIVAAVVYMLVVFFCMIMAAKELNGECSLIDVVIMAMICIFWPIALIIQLVSLIVIVGITRHEANAKQKTTNE